MKNNKNNQTPHQKERVLRAEDVFPPFVIRPFSNENKNIETNNEDKEQIPQLDLSEQIMAEHRKSTSVKRKSPSQKIESLRCKSKSEYNQTKWEFATQSQTKYIVKEIVTRDN